MLANPHPCHAGPGLGVTHLQRCWRRDGWARVGISPSHFPCFGAPDGAHAGEREGGRGVTWESSARPLPGQWPLRAAGQWGWVEGALIQDLASRGGSLTQRRLSGSDPSALTQAQWVEFRQQEKMSRLPSPLWGRCSSPLHDAQQQGGHRWAGRRQCHMSAGGSGCGGAAPVQSWRTPPRGRRGWGDGSRVRGDSTRPSGSAPRGPSSGSWGAAPGFPGVRAWVLVRVGAVPPDSTHQRISSLANALLSLSGLRWPQDLKHSQPG